MCLVEMQPEGKSKLSATHHQSSQWESLNGIGPGQCINVLSTVRTLQMDRALKPFAKIAKFKGSNETISIVLEKSLLNYAPYQFLI